MSTEASPPSGASSAQMHIQRAHAAAAGAETATEQEDWMAAMRGHLDAAGVSTLFYVYIYIIYIYIYIKVE